jgi:hypothetical protein
MVIIAVALGMAVVAQDVRRFEIREGVDVEAAGRRVGVTR